MHIFVLGRTTRNYKNTNIIIINNANLDVLFLYILFIL